jgi:hypothetical protein
MSRSAYQAIWVWALCRPGRDRRQSWRRRAGNQGQRQGSLLGWIASGSSLHINLGVESTYDISLKGSVQAAKALCGSLQLMRPCSS